MALTVAAVPTGMKAGVRIIPRGVEIAPVRAFPVRGVDGEGKFVAHSRSSSRACLACAVKEASVAVRIKSISGERRAYKPPASSQVR